LLEPETTTLGTSELALYLHLVYSCLVAIALGQIV